MSPSTTSVMPVRPTSKTFGLMPNKEFSLFGLRPELETLLQRFFSGRTIPFPFTGNFATTPAWDFYVSEDDKAFVVKAELPGFEPSELDIQVNENVLIIKAKKEEIADDEFGYGDFQRSVMLPFNAEPSKIQATYHHGVLSVWLPKPETAKAKHIPIKVE